MAIDTTLGSLRRDGSARTRAADHDRAVLVEARRRKERIYPGSFGGPRCGSGQSVERLAVAKAQAVPFLWQNRVKQWSAVLAYSVLRILVGPAPRARSEQRRANSA